MTRGERVIAFITKYCRVPEGKLVGQPMALDQFQVDFIVDVYDNPAGTTQGILSIARKNGKSGLIAAILLAHLVGPEARYNSQIVSGARSRKQAAVVYNLAAKMTLLNPALKAITRRIPSSKTLIGLTMNTTYEALAAEAGTAHGLSPVLAILDELGQVKGETDPFVEAIETAQGAYDDALTLIISTQAASDADMLSIRIDDAERSGDPTIVCHVHAADPECGILDKAAQKKANPALGTFRSSVELQKKAAQAARMPSLENSFRNLYLNQRVNRFAPLISPGIWKANGDAPDDEAFRSGVVFGGLDLSIRTDLTALVLVAKWQEQWHVRPYFWTPAATLADRSKRDRAPYDRWAAAGLMKATPGNVVDLSFVAADVLEIVKGMNVAAINYDRYRMDQLQRELDALGVVLPLQPFGQGFVSMAPALDAVEAEFLNERVCHGGHPVLTMCASNAVVVRDAAGNRKLDKAKSTGRIDGMVALAMAMGAAASVEDAPQLSIMAMVA